MANSIPKIVYDAGAGDVTVLFEYPPLGLDYVGQNIKFIRKVTESTDGKYQSSNNYIEDERNLTFRQVNKTIKELLDTFFITHAGLGKNFKYYVDSDESAFFTLELSRNASRYRPKRTGWNSDGIFTYEIKTRFRRVYS